MDFDELLRDGSALSKDLADLGVSWDDLAGHIGASLRGKPQSQLEVGEPRPLTEEEIILGAEVRASTKLPTTSAPEILKLRSRHHLIAQLLSVGYKPSEVALKTGYSISRISILQADPAFKELLENYKGRQENIEFDVRERLRLLSLEAIDELQARMDEKPGDFETKELFVMAELALDRTGHGKSAVVQHTYGLDAETQALIKSQKPVSRTANLLEGEQLVIDHDSRERSERRQAEPGQLDLFGPQPEPAPREFTGAGKTEDQAPRRAYESGVPAEEAGVYSGGAVELSAEERAKVSTAVYESGGSKGTVVQFRVVRPGTNTPEPVD